MSEQQHDNQNQTPELTLEQKKTELLRSYAEDTIKNVMAKSTNELLELALEKDITDDVLAPILEVSIHTTKMIMYPDFANGIIEKNKLIAQATKELKKQKQTRNVKLSEQDVIDSLDQVKAAELCTIQDKIEAVPFDIMRLAAIGKYRGLINPDFVDQFDSLLDVDHSVIDVYTQYEYDRSQADTPLSEGSPVEDSTEAAESSLSDATGEVSRRRVGTGALRAALKKIATGAFKAA